jgi:hypothetical protein
MKHRFNSGKTDGGDTTVVRPSNWNDIHVRAIRSTSATDAMTVTDDLILATAGAGGFTETLPAPASCSGQPFTIIKVDSAAGTVTVARNASENIKSINSLTDTSYLLVNAGQYVEVVSDGTNWWVTDAN